jgi:hypothetical protein
MKTEERVRSSIAHVGEGIAEMAWTVGRDPRERRRKQIVWLALETAVAATFTLVARRLVVKAWGVLTGERPPSATA